MSNLMNKITQVEDFIYKQAKWLLVGAMIVIVLLCLSTCNGSKKIDSLQKELNETYVVKRKGDTTILTQQQLLITKNDQLTKSILEQERLKSLVSQVKYKTVTVIKNVYVPFADSTKNTILVVHDTVSGDTSTHKYLELPQTMVKKDSVLYFKGTIDTDGLAIDSLSIPDSTSITIGTTKGLFKTQSVVRIVHTSPYVETTSLNNVVFNPEGGKKQAKAFGWGTFTGMVVTGLIVGLAEHYVPHR